MRAYEIMETESSSKAQKYLTKAEESFKNGFETEAARKAAMSLISSAYDAIKDEVDNNILTDMWALREPSTRKPLVGKENEYEALSELSDSTPYNVSQVREKHFGIFEKYGDLPMLKKIIGLRQEMKDVSLVPKKSDLEKAAKAAALAANTAIADATHPMKIAAMEKTRKEAEEYLEKIKAILEENDFDPYKVVPKPFKTPDTPFNISYFAEKEADAKRYPYMFMVDRNGSKYGWSENKAQKYIANCVNGTADHYNEYVSKMNNKIKNPVSAKFSWVSDVWGSSMLEVTLPDGTTEYWKTQIIVNVSKLGNLFNQWPTRRIK